MTTDESPHASEPADDDGSAEEAPEFEVVGHTPAEFASMTDELLTRDWTDEEFDVGDAGVFPLNGMWALGPASWEPAQPVSEWATHPVLKWAEEYRAALLSIWGPAGVHTSRVSPETGEPENVVDVIFNSLGISEAMKWQHDDRIVLLVPRWTGDPGTSRFDVLVLIVPETIFFGGIATLFTEEASVEHTLFHGETLTELHRRAALLAYVGGRGEETVLTPGSDEVGATRCSYRVDKFTWAHWLFTSDSRALLLILDTTTNGLLDPADEEVNNDAALEQLRGLYFGVPDDLLDLMARPASSANGQVNTVEGFPVNGRELPRISGSFFHDGADWHNSPGLMAYANQYLVGFDDVGFDNAVRRPLRLGGDFQPQHLLLPGHVNLADPAEVERALNYFQTAFDDSPYPLEPRPEGLIRLGASIPQAEDTTILDDIESAVTGWWAADLEIYEDGASPFQMAGRDFDSFGRRELMAHLGHAEEWTADVFAEWLNSLIEAATERWGEPFQISAHDPESGRVLRIPAARPLRGNGFESAPAWWVNGLVVSFVHGSPPRWDMVPEGWHLPGSRPGPIAFAYVFPADAIVDPVQGTRVDDLRYRVNCIASLQGVDAQSLTWDSTPIGYRANDSAKTKDLFEHTTAEAVRWVLPTPGFDHGYHSWHFTHDNRALLITWSEDNPFNVFAEPGESRRASVTFGDATTAYEKQAELYRGLPEDLLSLVADRREDTGMLSVTDSAGRSLVAATGVLWYDGLDWIVPTGLLTAIHEYVDGPGSKDDGGELPVRESITAANVIMGSPVGLRTAGFVVAAGNNFGEDLFRDDSQYVQIALGRVPSPEEVTRALNSYGTVESVVLFGDLQGFLDVRVHATTFEYLIPLALNNPDPRARRELFLWLLGSGASAIVRTSRSTNLTILLDNEVLDPGSDAILLDELLVRAADQLVNETAPRVRGGGHPIMQIADRDLPDAVLEPLYRAYFNPEFVDVDNLTLLGGLSAEDYVGGADFPHNHERSLMAKYIARCRIERAERLAQAEHDNQMEAPPA